MPILHTIEMAAHYVKHDVVNVPELEIQPVEIREPSPPISSLIDPDVFEVYEVEDTESLERLLKEFGY